MKNKVSFLVTLLMGIGLSSLAHAYTEACFTDTNGVAHRGEIVETYFSDGVDYADIHWTSINGAPDYQNRATALPFGSFYVCNGFGRPSAVEVAWFLFARPLELPIYVRYEPHYLYRGVVYHEVYPMHREYRPANYHVTINHTTVIRPTVHNTPVRHAPIFHAPAHGGHGGHGGGHHH